MYKIIISILYGIFINYSVLANTPTFSVGSESIIDIRNTGQALNLGDDSMSGMKNIGFDFTFYDQTFSQVNISMNGFFTFQSNFSVPRVRNYRSETLPATSFNYSVFPMWSDLINRNGTQNPYIQTFGNTSDTDQYFVVGWYNAKEYSNQLQNTFEAILYEGTNEIEFRYDKIQIKTHDITIGIQGNNESVTYLRYEDNNNTTYIETDDFSISTAIDESFSNLSSECLIDSSFSTLCDVYDLSNNFEDDDFLYGIDEDIIFGYDDDETLYGYSFEEDEYIDTSAIFITVDGNWSSDDNDYDIISYDIDYQFDQRTDIESDALFVHTDSEYDIEFINSLPDVEEGFLEIIEFEPITTISPEEVHDLEERIEEEFLVFIEDFEEEEEFVEVIEELFNEEEAIEEEEEELDESIDEISPEEVNEEGDERKERRSRNVRINLNQTNSLINSITSSAISSGTSNNNTNNTSVSQINTSTASNSTVNSPSISDQITSSQAQTNTVLESINLIPMPSLDNTPSVVMVEVQVTNMQSEIQSMTSTVVTSSEADAIADDIIANNIRSQQEQSEQRQEETGQYDVDGQSTLLAYMGFVPNFDSYTSKTIPQAQEWYQPRIIYTDVLDDNLDVYYNLVGSNLDTLNNLINTQPTGFFR
tara:strand:+ start:2080 stop:4020 length:1941 start_codon:yes stop_codon:yes gene_type:complete